MEIITFKASKKLKDAIKIAAVRAGFENTSEFIKSELSKNQHVSSEMKKYSKKVA